MLFSFGKTTKVGYFQPTRVNHAQQFDLNIATAIRLPVRINCLDSSRQHSIRLGVYTTQIYRFKI